MIPLKNIILLLTLLRCFHASFGDPYLLELYQSYCPYNKLCNGTQLIDSGSLQNDVEPCCLPCQCDAQCWAFSDCCPDAPEANKPEVLEPATCRAPRYASEAVNEKYRTYFGTKYMMIGSCPDHYDGPLRDPCAGIFDRNITLDDVVVVSDHAYPSRTFANKYCAKCNGIDDMIEWTLWAERCINPADTWNNLPLSEIEDFLLENCEITSRPHQGQIPAECVTGEQRCVEGVDKPEIVDACATSFLPTHPDTFSIFGGMLFTHIRKNIYCYACIKQDTNNTKKTLCERYQTQNVTHRSENFWLLLDLRTDVLKQQHYPIEDVYAGEQTCDIGEIYEHETERCRALHCVWFAGIEHNSCIPFGNIVSGCRLIFTLIMVVRETTPIPNDIAVEDIQFLEDELNQMTNSYSCPFYIRQLDIYRKRSSGSVAYLRAILKVLISDDCEYDHVLDNARKYMSNPWSQKIFFGQISLRTIAKIDFYKVLGDEPLHNTSLNSELMIYWNVSGVRLQHLKISMFLCPYVVLNSSEYNNIATNHFRNHLVHHPDGIFNITTILHDGFYAIADDKVAVCLDTLYAFGYAVTTSRVAMRWHFVMLCCIRFLLDAMIM